MENDILNTTPSAPEAPDFDGLPDLARYNYSLITITSTATGAHHRLSVSVLKMAARGRFPARDARVLKVHKAEPLIIGEVLTNGQIKVWKDGAGLVPEGVLWSLVNPLAAWEKVVRFELSAVCCKCSRDLSCPASIALGIGPTCGPDYHKELRGLNLFKLSDEAKFGEVRSLRLQDRPDLAGAAARAITNPDLRAAALRLLSR